MASGGVVSDKGIEVMGVDLTEELLCETIIVSFPYLVDGEQKGETWGREKSSMRIQRLRLMNGCCIL